MEESFKVENIIPELQTGWCHEETIINYLLRDKLTFLPIKYHYCFHREYDNPIDYNDVYIMHFPGRDKSSMLGYAKYRGIIE